MKRFFLISRTIIANLDMSCAIGLTLVFIFVLQSCSLAKINPSTKEMSVFEATLAVHGIIDGDNVTQVMTVLAKADDGNMTARGHLPWSNSRSIGYFSPGADRVTWNFMPTINFENNPTEPFYFVVRIRTTSESLYETFKGKVEMIEPDDSVHQTGTDSQPTAFVLNLLNAVENGGFEATVVELGLAYISEEKFTFGLISSERAKSERVWNVDVPNDAHNGYDYWLSDVEDGS